jgi:hypothetical protein
MPSTSDLLGRMAAGSRLFSMDILEMLRELRAEKQRLDEAIITLERLARGQGKRRGRPPKWMATAKRRGRPPGSKNKTNAPA